MARTVASESKRHANAVEPATTDSPMPELPNEVWDLIGRTMAVELADVGKLRLLNSVFARRCKCSQYQMAVLDHFRKRCEQRNAARIHDRNEPGLRSYDMERRSRARLAARTADNRTQKVLLAMARRYKGDMNATRDARLQLYELQLDALREVRDKSAAEEAWFLGS